MLRLSVEDFTFGHFTPFVPQSTAAKCTTCMTHIKFGNFSDLFRVHNKHLMTGPEGNSEFCFLRISVFPETKSREILKFEGNKIHCFPRDQSLSDLL